MIQRALAYKLLRDDGWAQAMGSLTSREVEDTVASLGYDPWETEGEDP